LLTRGIPKKEGGFVPMNMREIKRLKIIMKKLESLGDSPTPKDDVQWCIKELKVLLTEGVVRAIAMEVENYD